MQQVSFQCWEQEQCNWTLGLLSQKIEKKNFGNVSGKSLFKSSKNFNIDIKKNEIRNLALVC